MAIDSRIALQRLTSGQTLTPEEQTVLGIIPASPAPSRSAGPATSPDIAYDKTLGVDQYKQTYDKFLADQAAAEAATKVPVVQKITPTPETKVYTASDGKTFTDQQAYATYEANLRSGKATADYQASVDKAARQSAYDLLLQQFNQYGLGSLVEGIKGLIQENVSPSEFAIRLQNTDAYKQRFAANQDRIKQGLRALTPAEYVGLEDQYQNIMRNYGLPASYYSKDAMGTQAGFNKFIANDVSAAELEDRIATAQKRVLNADVNVTNALKAFYPDITNADILAYTLDPTNALENIKRKVTAAEIGGAAMSQGLGTSATSAEALAKYGVTKAQAQQGYQAIGEFLPTATNLADIYQKQGLGPYNQAVAEQEVFGTAGAAEAARKRKKLTQLEQAQFGAQAGTAQGALQRERQGAF